MPADACAQTPPALLDTWGASGTAEGQLDAPLRIDAADPAAWELAGAVFVIDGPSGVHRLQRFDANGVFVRSYGASLVDPVSVTVIEGELAWLPAGNIAVLDIGADEVRVLDAETGALVDAWPVPSTSDGDLDFDPVSSSLWVALTDLHVVQEYSLTGTPLRTVGSLGSPGSGADRLDSPRSVESRGGSVYVADTGNDRAVLVRWHFGVTPVWITGGESGSGPGQFDEPWSISSDCRGRVLVGDRGNGRIQRLHVQATSSGVPAFELVLDTVWFDDAGTFGDLIDLVNPTGPATVVGLPGASDPALRRDVIGPGVPGLFTLDRVMTQVRRYEDDCCVPNFFDPLLTVTTAGGAILVSPAGTGPTLADVGATVVVDLIDSCGDPLAGFPFQDMFLDDAGTGDISLCSYGSVADGNTDLMGRTTFSGAIAGGGYTQGGLRLHLAGVAYGPVLPIEVVSPDVNGDLVVNLADIAEFALDFGSGGYVFRADLDRNGQLSLGDLGQMALHLGETCP